MLKDLSIRIKLAVLAGSVIAVVVLGQSFQSLATESVTAQQEISLEARLVLVSLAGAISPVWTENSTPDLSEFAARVGRELEVRSLALVSPEGEVASWVGDRPTELEIRSVIQLRLRTVPRSLLSLTSGPIEFLVATPIMRGATPRGYLLCAFRSSEPSERLRELIRGALLTALLWVAVGGGLTLWVTGRLTRPLVRLAEDLAQLGPTGYSLPLEGRAESEIGVVQDRLVEISRRYTEEQRRVRELTAALRHQVDVVSADLARVAAQRQTILDSTSDAILLVRADGHATAGNGPAETFFGAALSDGVLLRDCVRDGEALARAMEQAVRLHEPVMVHAESLDPGKRGLPRHLRIRCAPVVGGAEAGAMVVVAEDVSESRELEEQMMRSERLASIGTLTAGLAHQIGNHLHTIKGYADLLSRRVPKEDAKLCGDLDAIKNEVRAASAMMEKVFLLARTRPTGEAPFAIPAVVHEAMALVRLAAERNKVTMVDEVASPGCSTYGDPQLFVQALLNIMMNAIQAMPKGGTLRVRTGCNPTGQCAIAIHDTGGGMTPDVVAHIFDPFFTTKPEGEGTGLGLPIAQRLVELHGGVIRVESTPGVGTTFIVEIALRQGPAAVGAANLIVQGRST